MYQSITGFQGEPWFILQRSFFPFQMHSPPGFPATTRNRLAIIFRISTTVADIFYQFRIHSICFRIKQDPASNHARPQTAPFVIEILSARRQLLNHCQAVRSAAVYRGLPRRSTPHGKGVYPVGNASLSLADRFLLNTYHSIFFAGC